MLNNAKAFLAIGWWLEPMEDHFRLIVRTNQRAAFVLYLALVQRLLIYSLFKLSCFSVTATDDGMTPGNVFRLYNFFNLVEGI